MRKHHTFSSRSNAFCKLFIAATLLCLASCGDSEPAEQPQKELPTRYGHFSAPETQGLPAKALPGGATTLIDLNPETGHSLEIFSRPAANLGVAGRRQFAIGNSFFTNPWVPAPAATVNRDGLGPLFNARACQDCHIRDGRGHPPAAGDTAFRAAVIKIVQVDGGIDPVYGDELQLQSVHGVPAEATVTMHWEEHTVALPDGQTYELRQPRLEVNKWHYGKPEKPLQLSMRVAPAMIGLGLLESIPEADLRNGRMNRVPDLETGQQTLGRFGWKASEPNVRQQSLAAFRNDLGITSALFPNDNCQQPQSTCRQSPQGGIPELTDTIEQAVTFYSRHLAVPARRDLARPAVQAGEQIFHDIGCASCHQPDWKTAATSAAGVLGGQHIFPYTDLALHDMGEGLADGLTQYQAGPRDWRTPPLWGLRYSLPVAGTLAGFLHDGRARTLQEAILWHGGEAESAKQRWMALPRNDRNKLIRFLATL